MVKYWNAKKLARVLGPNDPIPQLQSKFMVQLIALQQADLAILPSGESTPEEVRPRSLERLFIF